MPGSDRMRSLVSEAIADAEERRRQQSGEEGKRARALRPALQAHFEAAISMLICNAVQEYLLSASTGVFLSLDIARLGRRDPSKPLAEYSGLPKRVHELEDTGWLDVDWGKRTALEGRRQTVVRASDVLKQKLARWCLEDGDVVEHGPQSTIHIYGAPQSASTLRSVRAAQVEAQMIDINEHLVAADIRWAAPVEGVDLSQRVLHRSFRDEACTLGGRMAGGFWFQMSKRNRFNHLLLQGERPVELDYSGMVLRIAYGLQQSLPAHDDVYAVAGLERVPRDAVKILVNAMLWDEKPRTRLPRGTASAFRPINGRVAAQLVSGHHRTVNCWLQAGRGLELQRYESDIITLATQMAFERGIVALPVHDALYVPAYRAAEADEVMKRAFRDVCGGEAIIRLSEGREEALREDPIENDLFEDA